MRVTNYDMDAYTLKVPKGLKSTLLILVIAVGLLVFVEAGDLMARQSPVFKSGVDRAARSEVAKRDFEGAIKVGWPITYRFGVTDEGNDVAMYIPLSGTADHSHLYISARKLDGQWKMDNLYFVEGNPERKVLIPFGNGIVYDSHKQPE